MINKLKFLLVYQILNKTIVIKLLKEFDLKMTFAAVNSLNLQNLL